MPISDQLLDAVLQQESGGDPNAVNKSTGAAGIAQIMADTARKPGFGIKPISLKDRFNPKIAIPFARKYLNAMSERFNGNVAHTLAAYNWGPGNVDKWIKSGSTFDRLPGETRNYVVNILGNRGAAPPLSNAVEASGSAPMLLGRPEPEVQGSLQREEDLSGVPQDRLDDMQKILDKQDTRRAREEKARLTAEARAQARRRAAFRAGTIPGPTPRPNFRPAASGGGGRFPLKGFAAPAVAAQAVDPLATQQALVQGLLNPATSGGLLGARNLGQTGLLSPVQRRT